MIRTSWEDGGQLVKQQVDVQIVNCRCQVVEVLRSTSNRLVRNGDTHDLDPSTLQWTQIGTLICKLLMLHPFTQDLVTVVEVDDLACLEVNVVIQCTELSSFATSGLSGNDEVE